MFREAPLTLTLSRGERGLIVQMLDLRSGFLPLPVGEGRGEGHQDATASPIPGSICRFEA